MAERDYTFALNGRQLAARIAESTEGEHTHYTIAFEASTVRIHKDTLYTWTSDEPGELSAADIQSLGEQIDDPQA
jgi:hypothetical protein